MTAIMLVGGVAAADPLAEAKVSDVLEVSLGFENGRVRVTDVTPRQLARAEKLPSFMGRFTLLAVGDVTTRMRFDFPLLANLPDREVSEQGTRSSTRVRAALPPGLRELRILDARTGRTVVVNLRWIAALWPAPAGATSEPAAPALPSRRKR